MSLPSHHIEMTKLNLLLKCMEGDIWPGIARQMKLLHDRVLPNIDGNIKCGNFLIGPDYFRDRVVIDPDEHRRVRPFEWQKEFPEIIKAGGFDCVIGNPPYLSFSGRQKPEGFEANIAYWKARHPWDAWPTSHGLFLLRATELRRHGGHVGMIVPDQVGHLQGYGPLRARLVERSGLVEARYWGEEVFADAVTPSMTLILGHPGRRLTHVVARDGSVGELTGAGEGPWAVAPNAELLSKIASRGVSLGSTVKDPGVHTGNCSAKLILAGGSVDLPGPVPVLEGKQVGRYSCAPPTKALNLEYRPLKSEYFRIAPLGAYEEARYVIRQTAAYPIVGPRVGAAYFRNSLLALYAWPPHDDRYAVGLLNSKLMRFVYEQTTLEAEQKAFPQVKVASLRRLPIHPIDFSDPADVACHDKMVALVDRMLDLHKRLPEAKTKADRDLLERQIAATDDEIDALVYELYGLTDEEIAIVRGETD